LTPLLDASFPCAGDLSKVNQYQLPQMAPDDMGNIPCQST